MMVAIALDPLPGLAIDVAVASAEPETRQDAWVIGTNPVGTADDRGIFRWSGTGWTQVDGGGVRISVGGDGTPWVVNSAGTIFRRQGARWEQLPGLAKDIAAVDATLAWVVGTNSVGTSGDFGLFRWDDAGFTWTEVDGSGVAVAVEGTGTPWAVHADGSIYRRPGEQWEQLPGLARDIGVSFHGSAWVIGTNPVGTSGDFGVFHWDGRQWVQYFRAEGGLRIAVDDGLPDIGRPWVVNAARQIFVADQVP